MSKELTNKLLSLYRDLNAREGMRYFMPIEWDGRKWCSATEGHHLILIPETEENKLEPPPCKPVNVAGVIPKFDCKIQVPLKTLKNIYNEIPLITQEVTEECEVCDGDGKFEHYGEWYNCKTCKESGVVATGEFKKVKDPNIFIGIGCTSYESKFIDTLIKVLDFTNCTDVCIRYQKVTGITIFELDNGIIIGICAKGCNEDNEKILTVKLD